MQGNAVNLLVISRDVTARKQAELALISLNAGLEQRVETRTRELAKALQHVQALTFLGDALQQAQALPKEVAPQALAQIGPVLGASSMLVVRLDGEKIKLPVLWGDMPDAALTSMTRPGRRLRETPVFGQVVAARHGALETPRTSWTAPQPLRPFPSPSGPSRSARRTATSRALWWPGGPGGGAWLASEQALMRREACTLGLALERSDRLEQQTAQGRQLAQSNLELQRERTFLRAVLESMSEEVMACDEQGRLTLFNSATRQFHGLDTSSLPPEAWASHYALYGGDGESPLIAVHMQRTRRLCGAGGSECPTTA